MDKKNNEPKRKVPVEVPHRKHPEIQTTEYVFENKENREVTNAFSVPSQSDVLGSYTGMPAGTYEQPVQDADDL